MRVVLALAALLILSLGSRATTVTVQADDTSGFSFFHGDDLSLGVSVLAGTFQLANGTALSDAAIQAFATNFNNLMTVFTRFSTTEAHIGNGVSSTKGELNVSLTGTTATTPSLAGKQIYLLVVSGTDNSTVAKSEATVQQFGIYYLDKNSGGQGLNWAFPSDSDIPNTTTVDIADLTVSNLGMALKPGGIAHTVIGTFGTDHSNVTPSAFNFELAQVPEPSTGMLALIAAAGLLAKRRRAKG